MLKKKGEYKKMRQIKYSKSILVLLILMILLFTGCNFLKAVLPDTSEGTATTNTGSTTGSNEGPTTTSSSGGTSDTEASAPSTPEGITEFVEQEVLVRIKPGADIDKIVSEVGGTIIETLPQISVIRIKLAPKVSIAEAIKTLEKFKEVEYAEPNGICYMDLIPNDSHYGSQWAPQLTGAESAWDKTTGAAGVIIAITDTGVDGTHPDFEGKVIGGWDTYYDVVIPPGTDSSGNSHGTHCAGIAAAVGDNGLGMAGVAWGSKIMPVKICKDDNTSASWSDMAQAFMWAADHGADIISCSFGGPYYSQTMKDATDYAVIDMGCAMFVSMGNDSINKIAYPAGYQSVIAVGATDAHDEIASFSTTGDHMSVCAPGVEIYSTIHGSAYDYYSGTSMACPFAAGAAALVLSIYPGMSPEGVKTQLEDTAFDLGSTGFDSTYGYGRVDLAAAVGAVNPNKYGVVDVSVYDRLNNPISGASVILWQGGTVISTTNSNDGGRAKFEYIQAGAYEISASFPGLDSCLATDNPVTVVAGGSVSKTIAFSTAEIDDTSAYAITYQAESMEMLQQKIDQLAAEGQIPDSYQLNELSPTAKGITQRVIDVSWHSYPDATGYKVYRNVNSGVPTIIFQDEPTTSYDWYGFWDEAVAEGNSYTYYVTAYGSGWETDPSPEVTINTWLPPCSLISPIDQSIITDPTPTFTWNPVGLTNFPYESTIYSGGSDLWVYDETAEEEVWYVWFEDDLSTSTITYNDDGQATPLTASHSYYWNSRAYGYDENGNCIAASYSGGWEFVYSGGANAGITQVEAEAQTYVSSTKLMEYMEDIRVNWEGEGYFFNEPDCSNKEEVNHCISLWWKAFCETSGCGFKVYRSINGGSFELIFLNGAPPTGYEWYYWVDNEAGPGNTYSYYVTAYGSGLETDPSQTVTIDTWLPPCSLISPTDGSLISNPNPVFDWDPGITDFPYDSIVSGDTCMLVYDDTTSSFTWIICTGDPNISTVTYNQDDYALPLVNGHNYSWHCWTSGYDENWYRIAVSESIQWYFGYTGP